MNLSRELLIDILQKKDIHITFPNISQSTDKLIESHAIHALEQIKAIIEDDSLDDFMCIEKIVRVFENHGSSGGPRHDF